MVCTRDAYSLDWEDTECVLDTQLPTRESQCSKFFEEDPPTHFMIPIAVIVGCPFLARQHQFRDRNAMEFRSPTYDHSQYMYGSPNAFPVNANQSAFIFEQVYGYKKFGQGLNLNAQFYFE